MAIPTIPDLRTLMEAGVHFGHASGKWHPKMKPYIFAARDKLHIIDLEKTREQLASVLPILEERIRAGKTIVLVGTKKQITEKTKEMGEKLNIPYVEVRWLGGTMTNFGEMQKSISRMKKLEAFLESDEANTIIKKERVMKENDLARMRSKFGGLKNLTRKPDALLIIDPSHEHNAVKEAKNQGIEIFAVVDTNCDPTEIDHLIPANDDGVKSLNLIMGLLEQTIANGQKLISVKGDEKVEETPVEVVADLTADEADAIEEEAKEDIAKETQTDKEIVEEIELVK